MAQKAEFLVALFLILVGAGGACAETLAVPVGRTELSGEFEKPAGAGPFPVVILMHGCGGKLTVGYRKGSASWTARLQQQGYATLVLDSFSARGYASGVCAALTSQAAATGTMQERLRDLYVLAGRTDVKPDKIADMGFSHGGWTLLNAAASRRPVSSDRERLAGRHGKRAAIIGFYPACADTIYEDFVAPILILVGDSDDWTPPLTCRFLAERQPARALPVRLKIYPGARHGFDVGVPPRTVEGHLLEYNPAAAEDAAEDARRAVMDFLTEALK